MPKDKKKVREYNKTDHRRRMQNPAFRDKKRDAANKWCKENKSRRNTNDRKRRAQEKSGGNNTRNADANRRCRLRLKNEVMNAYGGACACCGETELEFLTIDHINNDGAKQRRDNPKIHGGGALYRWLRKQDWPSGFQCLCMNCNWSKRLGGVCIHQRPTVQDAGITCHKEET